MKSKQKYHLVASGDSLFGPQRWACGPCKENESGVFGSDGTLRMVTCKKCMSSKLYREICAETGAEHPFSAAAKKAWRTMRERAPAGRFESIAREA